MKTFFPIKQQLVTGPSSVLFTLDICIRLICTRSINNGITTKSFHSILQTGSFSNLTPSIPKHLLVARREQAEDLHKNGGQTHPLPVLGGSLLCTSPISWGPRSYRWSLHSFPASPTVSFEAATSNWELENNVKLTSHSGARYFSM